MGRQTLAAASSRCQRGGPNHYCLKQAESRTEAGSHRGSETRFFVAGYDGTLPDAWQRPCAASIVAGRRGRRTAGRGVSVRAAHRSRPERRGEAQLGSSRCAKGPNAGDLDVGNRRSSGTRRASARRGDRRPSVHASSTVPRTPRREAPGSAGPTPRFDAARPAHRNGGARASRRCRRRPRLGFRRRRDALASPSQ
jgi:hypothetical protein